MNIRWVLQTAFLVISLGATILAMIALKKDHSSDFLASLGLGNSTKINWCDKRVAKVRYKDVSEILEKDGKWGIQTRDEHILIDYVNFEKWLAQFCLLRGEKSDAANALQEPISPLYEVEFIDGDKVTLYRLGADKFQIKQLLFKSSNLEKLTNQYLDFFPPSLRPPAQ